MERVDHPYIIKTYGHFIVDVADQARFVFIFMQVSERLSWAIVNSNYPSSSWQLAEGDSLSVYMRQVNALESPLIPLMPTHLQVKVGLPEATCRRMFAQQVCFFLIWLTLWGVTFFVCLVVGFRRESHAPCWNFAQGFKNG